MRPTLAAKPRTISGKKVKQLRSAGLIPGVVYGRKVPPVNVELDAKTFEKLYREVGSNTVCKLELDSEDRNVLIHEPSVHPVSGLFEHVDIYQVDMTQKITAEVPISFINEAPAVRGMDGSLVTNKDTIKVECLPADLPHEFEVDLSVLVDFEVSIKVEDIKAVPNVEILEEPEETIVSVDAPRSEEEMAALEEAPVEGELPEVIGAEPVEGEEVASGEEAAPVASEDKE